MTSVSTQPAEPGSVIGIVGGVGPACGLDLAAKIITHTKAGGDRDHLPVIMASLPEMIPDRTDFLLGRADENPAYALAEVVGRLQKAGAGVIGVPCNTAHAEPIWDKMNELLNVPGPGPVMVNMLDETCRLLAEKTDQAKANIAVLSTLGTYHSGVYGRYMARYDLSWSDLGPDIMEKVHQAIYDPVYGIKGNLGQGFARARTILERVLLELKSRGFGTVVLGCTELPLVFKETAFAGLKLLDPTTILARALIQRTCPEKLL